MELVLYNNTSDRNTINKVIEKVKTLNITLKRDTNISNPMIRIKSDTKITFNYAYIPKFNRYYFVEEVTVYPNKIYSIEMNVDVLESFKNDILNASGTIKQHNEYNPYYNTFYDSEVRKEIDVYNSNVSLDTKTPTKIMVNMGG